VDFTEEILKSKLIILIQQTKLITICTNTIIQIKQRKNYYADEDTFFQGNKFFSISQNDDLKTGDASHVCYGISKAYYNYINVIVSGWR
jgi:hypothetical protein